MDIEFYVVAGLLIALAALFVVFPVLLKHGNAELRRQTNVEVFKERQQELDRELQEQLLSEQQHRQLLHELQRRLLEDEQAGPASQQVYKRPPAWLVLALVAVMAVFAVLVYQHNGFRPDWQIARTLDQARALVAAGKPADEQRLGLLEQVSERLQARPDEPFYLMLKGNLEMELGRFREAQGTFTTLTALLPDDPTVMAALLEMRYMNAGRKLDSTSMEMARGILAIDPNNVRTLGLLGIDSFEQGNFQAAIDYWQQLLPLVGPFSPNGKMIGQGIERARQLLASQGVAATDGAAAQTPRPAAAAGTELQLAVSLAPGLQADPQASVFIYARPAGGARMPLAVKRLTVADLPAQVILDDSMAMAPGMNLSSAKQVELVARISKRGMANRGSGDIEGVKGPIEVGAASQPVELVIDAVVP